MKKTLKYIAVFTLALLLSSCGNDWLNLEKDDSFSSNEDLTLENLVSMQIGMFNAIHNSSNYYGARMIYDAAVRGDDFQYSKTGSSRADDSYLFSYDVSNATSCWADAYYLNKTANSIIEADVSSKKTDEQADIDNIKGQAYFMRALSHFDVLRSYGEFYDIDSKWGIPIIGRLVPGGELASNKPGRNTVREVYEFIVKDLKDNAIPKLRTSKAPAGFFDVWAAKALLCRVYLYMGENQLCMDLAQSIITDVDNPYGLLTNANYMESWSSETVTESFFKITYNTDDNLGREGIGYLMYFPGGLGYGDVIATLGYENLFQDGDVRKNLFVANPSIDTGDFKDKKVYMMKYPGVEKASSGDNFKNETQNIHVLRLSEVYLNGAEAAQKLGDAKADTWLTAIAQRANPAAPAITGANLERVLLERRLELGGEGFRFFDALRNNKTMYRDDMAKYMEEVNAAVPAVTIAVPATLQEDNEKLHPAITDANMSINRDHAKIVYPIPEREMNVINENGAKNIEQYYKW